jgi:transposase
VEGHVATQAHFVREKLEPPLAQAEAGHGHVFCVDAAHFVLGSFLACVWCLVRRFIRGGSGRQRYNVLGAWNAVTRQLVRITNATVVNAETMCALLRALAGLGLAGPITLFVDNARYQHCKLVMALAQELGIRLEFLPSYSPNLNRIERLWKFVKKKVLYGRHYATFADFQRAIDGCLDKVPTDYPVELKTLMTTKFQTFDKVSFLAA